MIVISDTGPLNYLLRIEAVDVLPYFYQSVIIPEDVRQEMLHPNTPENVRAWAEQLPEWVIVRQPQFLLPLLLDRGERAAISLALEMQIRSILMDERRGRQVAEQYNLDVTGTLGVLANAARGGLLDFDEAVEKLRKTGFYVSPVLIETLRNSDEQE